MSIETQVSVGTYLICKQRAEFGKREEFVHCSRNESHHVEESFKFCPECGAVVRSGVRGEDPAPVALTDFLCQERPISEQDLDWLSKNFSSVFTGVAPEGHEIVTYDPGTKFLSGDTESCTEIDTSEFVVPTYAIVDQLKSIVGYSSVEVKFGVIVTQS
jgi:hypothetical protein